MNSTLKMKKILHLRACSSITLVLVRPVFQSTFCGVYDFDFLYCDTIQQ